MGRYNDIPFTCANVRYHTDIENGGPRRVIDTHLSKNDDDGTTLWLEYIVDTMPGSEWNPEPLWLMWYDRNGNPTISHSAAFDKSILQLIGSNIFNL